MATGSTNVVSGQSEKPKNEKSFNILTKERKAVIDSITKVLKEGLNLDNASETTFDTSAVYTEGKKVYPWGNDDKKGKFYTIRENFAGIIGHGPNCDIPRGAKNESDVAAAIQQYFSKIKDKNTKENLITDYCACYTDASLSKSVIGKSVNKNRYCNGKNGVYTCDGPGRNSYIGNCTAYSYGRFIEILAELNGVSAVEMGESIEGAGGISHGWGGNEFFKNTKTNSKYFKKVEASDVDFPPVGSIVCTTGTHNMIIEKIDKKNNKLWISQGAYSKSSFPSGHIFKYTSKSVVWKKGTRTLNGVAIRGFVVPKKPK